VSSAWGVSWGAAWNGSWGSIFTQLIQPRGGYAPPTRRKKSHREEIEEDIRAILADRAPPEVIRTAIRAVRKIPAKQLFKPLDETVLLNVAVEVRQIIIAAVKTANLRAARRRRQQQTLLLM